jgi:hypothetical protein
VAIRVNQTTLISEVETLSVGHLRVNQAALIFEVPVTPVTLVYPLSPPVISGIGPQDFTVSEVNVVGETVSPFTLSDQEQQWPGQMLTIDANLPPMPFTQGEQWVAFLGALFGKYGTFLMGDYNRPTPQGAMSGSPVVNGANPSGFNQLLVRGAAASVANWAVAGDYLQITAGTGLPQRIFKVLQNANSNGSGDVTLAIFPNIREALTDGTTIVTANCQGTFRLQQNTATWKIDRNRMYAISFKAREALLP